MSVTTSKGALSIMRKYMYGRVPLAEEEIQRERVPRLNAAGHIYALLLPWIPALILFVGWYLSTTYGQVNSLILPAPASVFSRLVSGIEMGIYLTNTLTTLQESMFGFLLAVVVSLPLGYGLAKSRLLSLTIKPYLVAGQAIPAIVIAPLLVLWLGYGTLPSIVLCMLVVLFPMVINTVLGVETLDRTLVEAARVEGASGWSMLAHIEFPLALPALLAALRTGLTLSVVGALVGEFVSGGDQGLGALVLLAKNQYDLPFMFATLLVLAMLAIIYYGITGLLTKLADIVY